ncbi:MAG TPA: hypothetical protein PKC91_01510 [Ignavibacteria bacterium]|nr:hypothetical protein [Ignavibacteria bacterium]
MRAPDVPSGRTSDNLISTFVKVRGFPENLRSFPENYSSLFDVLRSLYIIFRELSEGGVNTSGCHGGFRTAARAPSRKG